MSSLLTDTANEEVKYVVKVNGVVRTAPLRKVLAEATIATLPVDEQPLAELVPVTSDGQEILFG